jgi:DNA-binding winged helix-turn-helix (wHTH) protein
MRYRFVGVELDTDTYELGADNRRIDVEPQVFDVLIHLLVNRERVVTKEELLDSVWGDRFVSDSALTTRIKQARQAVGDDGRAQRVIKTVHGRGYRFVAVVDEATSARPASSGRVADAPIDAIPPTHYVGNDGASIAY